MGGQIDQNSIVNMDGPLIHHIIIRQLLRAQSREIKLRVVPGRT